MKLVLYIYIFFLSFIQICKRILNKMEDFEIEEEELRIEGLFNDYFLIIDLLHTMLVEDISIFSFDKYDYFVNVFIKLEQSFPLSYFLKYNSFFNFKLSLDCTVTDHYYKLERFKIFYIFLNVDDNRKISFFFNSIKNLFSSSISNIFRSLVWAEREVWDLFGIFFINNNNLRRILTDYGFRGYPLRKDFPLSGYIELYFNNSSGDITYRPVQLSQELRFFNFSSC